MLLEERIRVVAFALAVCAVYSAAFVFALRRFLSRHQPRNRSRAERLAQSTAFVLAGIGAGCFAYGLFVEPYWPEVVNVRVQSAKVSERVRIVHLSDIHSDRAPRLEERLPAIVGAQHPDLIVFTGDSINVPDGLPIFRALLTKLVAIAPTVAVRGNWDVWYWSAIDLFGGTGVREVASSAEIIPLRGGAVWVGGLSVHDEDALPRLTASAPHDALRVLMHHYPDEIFNAAKHGVDLYLAGHTHGGQVALPWYGALVTLSRLGKQFEQGLKRVDKTWIYVNRGIGMEGGSAPRVRFCARPEITVIDVEPMTR